MTLFVKLSKGSFGARPYIPVHLCTCVDKLTQAPLSTHKHTSRAQNDRVQTSLCAPAVRAPRHAHLRGRDPVRESRLGSQRRGPHPQLTNEEFMTCTWHIRIYMTNTWYVHELYTNIHACYIHDTYMLHTWYIHDTYMIYIYIYIHMYACMYVCMYLSIFTYIYIYIHRYVDR